MSDILKEVENLGKQFLSGSSTGRSDNNGRNNSQLFPSAEPNSGNGRSGADTQGSASENGDRKDSGSTGSGSSSDNQADSLGDGISNEPASPRVSDDFEGISGHGGTGSGSSEKEHSLGESGSGTIRDEGLSPDRFGREADTRTAREALSRIPEKGIIDAEDNPAFSVHEGEMLNHIEKFRDSVFVDEEAEETVGMGEEEFTSPSLPPLPKTKSKTKSKGKTGAKPKSKTKAKDNVDDILAQATESSPFEPDASPLSEQEWGVFTDSLMLISEIMDDLEGYTGLDTDPEFGGNPIWTLEKFEAEAITKSYRALAQKRPVLYKAARTVNMVSVHAEAAIAVGSRVIQSVTRHIAEGFHFRLNKHKKEEGGQNNVI